MFRSVSLLTVIFFLSLLFCVAPLRVVAQKDAVSKEVIVNVNKNVITQGDVDFFMLSRNIPAEQQEKSRKKTIEILIDRRLMSDFLAKRKVTVSPKEIDTKVTRIHNLIRKKGDDPQKVLKKMGLSKKRLREEIQLPLLWGREAREIITDTQLRKYYKKYQHEFDGTKIRAKHIFIALKKEATEEDVQQAEQKLLDIRKKIEAGDITFAMAAKQYSESPSKKEGGDVGLIRYRGEMPKSFCLVAFQLKVNEISQPVRTSFGWHLITVTKIKKGDISLEDVRSVVFNRLAAELWDELVKQQRKKATIKWYNKN